MYMNVEFRSVSVDQNVLSTLEDHSGSVSGGCSHGENVLWLCWDVQGSPQRGVHMSASAVNQTAAPRRSIESLQSGQICDYM